MSIKAGIFLNQLNHGEYDPLLRELYGDEQQVLLQRARYRHALQEFISAYGNCEINVFSAPGRTEICGNHTDHQRGKVIAASVTLDAIAIAAKTDDQKIVIRSKGYKRTAVVRCQQLQKSDSDSRSSQGLIRGTVSYLQKAGYNVGGFSAYVSSNVISGSGLSSSAAFEVLIGTIISGLYNDMKIDPAVIARAGQYAENEYFGKPSGLMDQMACALGGMVYIDFKDAEKPVYQKIRSDPEKAGYVLCITNTRGSHSALVEDYAAVPEEMRQVAGMFGKNVLREVEPADFYNHLNRVRELKGDRAALRAIHFFTEEARVDAMMAALERDDFQSFLKHVKNSGDSSFRNLQNIYSPSDVTIQPLTIALALSEQILNGEGACRVHGGGFGGTIQAYVPLEKAAVYKEAMDTVFGEDACYYMKIRNKGGIEIV